jgi:hypothetical protein
MLILHLFPLAQSAVLTAFLICLLLILRFSNSVICAFVPTPLADGPISARKAAHTCSCVSSLKWSATWMHERNASSNALTQLVAMKRIPR